MSDGSSDDLISLEDLMRDDTPLASVASSVPEPAVPVHEEPPAHGAPAESATKPNRADEAPDLGRLDQVLGELDPEFTKSLGEIQEASADGSAVGDVEIDSLDLEKALREMNLRGWRRWVFVFFLRPWRGIKHWLGAVLRSVGRFRGSALSMSKEGLHAALGALKGGLGSLKSLVTKFFALPVQSKLMAVAVLVLAIAFVFVVRLTLRGRAMPDMGPGFLTSFADVADQKWDYDPHETMEEFNNPLLHPENVVLLEKIVVNLLQPEDGSNPMGMFELYVETATHEAAIEIKDREIEARDAVARTLEQMRYDDLITLEGKERMKLMIRKNLNTLLTQGRVRKVFFKTVVLKP